MSLPQTAGLTLSPACLTLRLPLALLDLACAWQINHKMALWFNATLAPPGPVNSAASVPDPWTPSGSGEETKGAGQSRPAARATSLPSTRRPRT